MVAIFTGLGAGAERGSSNVLGNSGLLGSGTLGRSGERVHLNAASGNLLIEQRDEMLIGRGPDVMVGRTYNSLGDLSDENGDNWRMSTDRRVYGLTGTANASGSTVKRMSADGSEITYAWNASASAYIATDGSGAYDKLTWAASSSTWTWTDGDSQVSEAYAYAATGGRYLITKATDTNGNALTYSYLTDGKLNRVTTADGSYTQYGWSGSNITLITTGYTDLATSTAKTLTRTRYGYDASNRLTTVTVDLTPNDNVVTDAKTYVTTYTYDGTSKRVASINQTDGSALTISYDASFRVKTMAQTAATGVTRTTTIDYQTGFTNVTDPTGQVTRLDHDAKGQLTKITAPPATSGAAQQVTQFGYTANGDLTSVIDAAGNTAGYTNFTAFGVAQTVTDRMGAAVTRTFGSKNELLTETRTASDQSGAAVQQTSRYVYDTSNRVRFELSADGNVVEHRYDDTKGGVESLTLSYTGQFYSLSGLTATQTPTLAQMTSWAGGTDKTAISQRSFEYDARGNMTANYGYHTPSSSGSLTTPTGTFYTYDQAGQLLSTNTYAHVAETYVYDGLGRVISSVDLQGGTTSIVFNDAATSTVVTLAGGLVQTSTYNKAGELVSFAESGANTTVGTANYKYDALGRMRVSTDATGHKSYVVYDAAGRKVADVDHYGMLTEYKYDAENRVVASVTYTTYLTSAQLTSLDNPLANVALSTLRPTANAKDIWSWKVFDKEGRTLQAIDGTGHTVRYEYDASGRLVRTTGYYNKLTATALGGFKTTPPTAVTLPTADAARDRVSRTFYDKSGRMVGMLDGEGFLTRVDYDAGGRKVAETAFANATTVGNRASGSFATLTTGLANAAADRTTRYVYDGQGLQVFTIDALNRVTEFVYQNADAADVNGMARQTIRYAGTIGTPGAWTAAGVRTALSSAQLTGNVDNRSDWAIYDNRDRLTYSIDASGAVTGYKYDSSGNVTKVTRFANIRFSSTLFSSASMDSWATGAASAANDRVTRNYYNARNELRYSVDGEGYVTRTDYDAEGRSVGTVGWFNAIAVSDSTTIAQVASLATGGTIATSTSYDMDGRVASTIDGTGAITSYVYDATGGMLGKIYRANSSADQARTDYAYDGAGRVISQTEGAGTSDAATTSFGFDGLGNLLTTQDPTGNSVASTYDRAGRRMTSTDPNGLVTSFQYNAFDDVVAVVDARGKASYTYYDALGRATMGRDANDRVDATSYNVFGEIVSNTRYANKATNSASSGSVPVVAADASRDAKVTYSYDTVGRVLRTVDAELAIVDRTYNAFGDALTRTDPLDTRKIQTKFTYDRRGLLRTQVVDAATGGKALTTTFGYDAFGRQVTLADARSAVTTKTYDNNGRLATSRDALNNTTTYNYDRRGNLAATTDALGAVTRYTYDSLDRMVYTIDALGNVTQSIYNKNGEVTQTLTYSTPIALTGVAVVTTTSAITALITVNPATDKSVRSVYDKNGWLRFSVDGVGNLTEFVYDAAGNAIRSIAYAAPVRQTPTYTIAGMQAEIAAMTAAQIAASLTDRSVYDAAGQRTYGIDAMGFVTSYTYDSRGNVVGQRRFLNPYTGTDNPAESAMASWATANASSTDRLSRAVYDRDDRLRFDVDAENYVTQYVYDKASHLTQTIRYAGRYPSITSSTTLAQANALVGSTPPATAQVTAYFYDSAGRLEREIVDPGVGKLNFTTGYSYDANGNVVAMTDAAGRVTRYVYDALNRQTWSVDAAGYANETRYDAIGNARTMIRYANRVADAATLAAWPLGITAAQAAAGIVASDANVVTRSFDDRNGRLAYAIDGEGYVTETRYDSAGNVAATIRYAGAIAATDAMTAANVAALLPASIPADAAKTTYVYDRANRLTDTVDAVGSNTHFEMNALGDIIGTTEAYGTTQASTTFREFDRLGRVTRETRGASGSDQWISSYGYNAFGDATTGIDSATAVTRREFDALGRVVREYVPVNGTSTSDLATTKAYDAFGRVVQVTDPNGNSGFFHYDKLDRLTVQVDSEGYVTQTTYTITGQKESVVRYADRASAVGDAATNPTIASGSRDAITTFGYDLLDRLAASTDAQGFTESYVLDAFGNRVAVTNKLGGVTFNAFDRRGLMVSETTQIRWTDPAQNLAMGSNITNSYAYDSRGNLTTKIEGLGRSEARTTRYGYDHVDRLTLTTHDLVEVLTDPATGMTAEVVPIERAIYDLRGNLIESVDAAGARTLFYYDGSDRKIAEVSPIGTLTTWQYDGNGNALFQRVYGDAVPLPAVAGGTPPSTVVPGDVRVTAYSYDRNNRLVATTVDAVKLHRYDGTTYTRTDGVSTGMLYDGLGNVVRERDGNGGLTFHYFDKLGREVAKVDPEGYLTTWHRDAEGNVTLERRYANKVAGSFDQTTAPASLVLATGTASADDRITAFAYNRNGQRVRETRFAVGGLMNGATGVTQPVADAVIRYTYNGLGEVLSKHEATGEAINYTYDDSGRLIRQQDAAVARLGGLRLTTDFAYDGLNNVVSTRESAAVNTSAAAVFDDPVAPPPPPVPVPVTTTRIGIEAADGNSVVTGTAGNDLIFAGGEANNYELVGGQGDDWLINASWNGGLNGGVGNDVLEFRSYQEGIGGAGSDFFVFDVANLHVAQWQLDPQEIWGVITDFTKGVDKVALLNSVRSFSDLTLTQVGSDVEVSAARLPKIIMRNMTVGNLSAADFVISAGGNTGARPLSSVVPSPITTNTVAFLNDAWAGTAANDAIFARSGDDGEAVGEHGAAVSGGGGDDHIITESFQSTVTGGDGNDVIEVRAGEVMAIGGSGNDTFVFDLSRFNGESWQLSPEYIWGTIVGFTSGQDRIAIPNRTFAELSFAQVGTDVEITMAGAPRIIIDRTKLADLKPTDFLFPKADASTPAPVPTAVPTTATLAAGPNDRVNTFVYGAGGRLLSQTDASNFTRSFAYDVVGRVVRESYDRERSDGDFVTEGRLTGYDLAGRVSSEYAATLVGTSWLAGDITSTHYNAYGDAVAKNVNGLTQEVSHYDALGRVIKSNGSDGVWREYGYDGNGNVTLTVASNGFAADRAIVGDLLTRGLNGEADAVLTYSTYDKRNLATASFEVNRQLGLQVDSVAVTRTILKQQAHNAFGEIVWDVNELGALTNYRYNSIGKLIERMSAPVSVANANGTVSEQRPTERYHYDLSGRMVGMDDANGRRTHRTLHEGSGYGDDDALVVTEYRPDASTATTEYDIFGDAVGLIDGLNRRTDQTFDKMGRLIASAKPAAGVVGRLTDTYGYDGLGQRIRHSNSVYQAPVAGQTYPYYDTALGGTFFMSPSGRYLVLGAEADNAAFANQTLPVTYQPNGPAHPGNGPSGRKWAYDAVRGYAVLLPAGITTYTPPANTGGGGDPDVGDIVYGVETTDYDLQGRVVSTVDFAGDLTAYTYQWNAGVTAGLGFTGGWIRTVNDRSVGEGAAQAATDSTDVFGRTTARTDLGGGQYAYSFDMAGRQIGETETRGGSVTRTVTNTFYNTGLLASTVESTGLVGSYGYDAAGNKVHDLLALGSFVKQDGRATYDVLGRMVSYRDVGAEGGLDNVNLRWSYDAVGNIRSLTLRYRPMDPGGLSAQSTTDQTLWYSYDAMNRVVISQGSLVGTTIVRGWGVELTYDGAGQRRTAITSAGASTPGYAAPGTPVPTTNAGAHRESYTYSDDGHLIAVDQANADANGAFGGDLQLARYSRDLLGRITQETDYDASGTTAVRSRYQIAYDNRGLVLSESSTQVQGTATLTNYVYNQFGPTGTLLSSSTHSSSTAQGSTTTNATTTYQYVWRDSALTSSVTLSNRDGTTQSLYSYDVGGRLSSVTLTGGQRPRTVNLTTDFAGQILTRQEVSATSVNPFEKTYFFDGIRQGAVNNDGTDNTTFAAALAASTVDPGTNPGPFRGGAFSGSAYANFDRQHDAVNLSSVDTSSGSYTVRGGDTLAAIAQSAWGDANLWYLIASANGMSGAETLVAGQTIIIPNKTVNRANTSETFRPYDPNEALGDVQPNTPTPRPQAAKKKNKCGVFGAILLAVVAIAVTVVTAGATAALGPVLSGAVAGAAGSVVSQAVGVATGIQDKFSFKGVALAAISGGVGGGVTSVLGNGAIGGSQFLGNVVRGAASSALTQGVAVATGLQKRFDWAGVAAAGLGNGAAGSIVSGLGVDGSLSAGNIGRTLVVGAAGGIANAATRSLIDGSDFGDNVLAALPSVIALTVGNIVATATARARVGRDNDGTGLRGTPPEPSPGQAATANAAANMQRADTASAAQDPDQIADIVVVGRRSSSSRVDTSALAAIRSGEETRPAASDTRRQTQPAPAPGAQPDVENAPQGAKPRRVTITNYVFAREAEADRQNYFNVIQETGALLPGDRENLAAFDDVIARLRGTEARIDSQINRDLGTFILGPLAVGAGLATGGIGFGLIAEGSYALGGTTLVLGANEAAGGARNLATWGNGRTPLAEAGNRLTGTGRNGLGVGDFAVIGADLTVGGVGAISSLRAGRGTIAAESTVWELNPFARGQQIEQALGQNLPGNFPVIDRFENGVATSIKSLDLDAATYQSNAALNRILTGYVDKVAVFQGRTWAGVTIRSRDISGRALDLAIPNSGSASQQAIISQSVRYGASRGVTVNVITFP